MFPVRPTLAAGPALRLRTTRSLFHSRLTSTTLSTLPQCQRLFREYHNHPRSPSLRTTYPLPSPQLSRLTTTFTTSRRLQSTHSTPRRSSFLSPRYIALLLVLAVAGAAWDSQWLFPTGATSSAPQDATILGPARSFVRFDVISKSHVSPTSFILTLKPSVGKAAAPLASLWDVFDLWCVEVKQPQIQVAREYTPLPPPTGAVDPETLRLYVRAVRGGEVSTYLSRLAPGIDSVELRGPHGEFDLRSRLGSAGGRVVFLAGGTGIASALQAARAVLPAAGGPAMTIFWAVRSRDEIQGGEGGVGKTTSSPPPSSWWRRNPFSGTSHSPGICAEALSAQIQNPSPVTRELLALKETYGDRIDVRVVVDDEGTRVQQTDLAAALAHRKGVPPVKDDGCQFHSQKLHVGMVDGAPNAGVRSPTADDDCACSPKGAGTGKNLFVVSGPEGFVQAYAGAKIWRDGGQLQGSVGGMLGVLQRSSPDLLKDWIVLKL